MRELFYLAFWASYAIGPFLGLYAAFQHHAFWHAAGSIVVPYYGIVYWMVA